VKFEVAVGRRQRATTWLAGALVSSACLFVFSHAAACGEEEQGEFRAYALRRAQADAVEPVLQQALSALNEDAEVAVDARGNRLLVRGSAEAQRLAQELIRSLDRANKAAPAGKPVLRTYAYVGPNPQAIAAEIQAKYDPHRGVRVAADVRTGQLLVVAPAELQPEIAKLLAAQNKRAQSSPNGTEEIRAAAPPRTPVAMAAPTAVRLSHAAPREIEQKLRELWQGRLAPVAQTDPDAATLVVPFAGQLALEVQIDRRTREVAVRGPATAVASCLKLLETLDQGETSPERESKIVPIHAASASYVQRALSAVDGRGGPRAAAVAKGSRGALQLAARMFQSREQAPEADQAGQNAPDDQAAPQRAAPPAMADADEAEPADDEDGALVGPVEIEQLPGLDAIIVRGSHRDVERVMQIIEDIERLSAEAEPTIEIYYLKNVASTAMAEIIGPMYGTHFAPHQGAVSITALVKPNALLLIGREGSIKSALDLISRLDLPGDPANQFRVFRLKHATASVASGMVTQFFANRAGLAGSATVTPDARSNSLIIQASPRDLVEISQLIRRIDTPTSAAVNEMRIFPLRNSLAEELAPILQAAVAGESGPQGGAARAAPTTQGPGGQGGGRGQPPPGAPVPASAPTTAPGEGAAATTRQAKSLMLRLMTIDDEGQRQISSGILSDVRITANPRSNSLIVSAPAENMELLAALIYELDRGGMQAPAQIKVFTIVNGDATAMTDLLEELFGQAVATGGGGGGGQGRGGFGGPAQQGMAPSNEEGPPLPLHFSVDSRTNSIIVAGSAADLAVVEAILLRLDESKTRQRQSTVYRLRNSPAIDVALAINEFLRTERQFQQTTPGLLSPFEQIEREVVVVPEIVSNSLIVSATPRFYDEVERIVKELDTRPPMVMIQVLIAQVSLQGTDEFGIEVGLQNSVLFDRSLLGSLATITQSTQQAVPGGGTITATNTPVVAATLTPGYDFNNSGLSATGAPAGITLPNSGATSSLATASQVGAQGLSNFGLGRINNELGYGGLVLSASSDAINVLLRALRERRRLEVLSRPQVMTLDNQPAYIQVGQAVPLLSSSSVGLAGTIAGVNYRNVGLIVAVTPRISPDGMVVMEIDAEKSQIGPASEGIQVGVTQNGAPIRQPRIDITQAQTTISAMDGQTVVFGGMLASSNQLIQRRVPGLSQIPLLGRLFRYDFTQTARNELLIVMTPRIVRSAMDADDVKQLEATRMSWCLADIQKIHGDAGLRGRGDVWTDDETITIYPDDDPAGVKPQGGELVPAPQPNAPAMPPGDSARRAASDGARRMAAVPADRQERQPAVQSVAPRPAERAPAGELRLRPAAQHAPPPGMRNQVVPADYRATPPQAYGPRNAPPQGYVERVIYDAPTDRQRYRR